MRVFTLELQSAARLAILLIPVWKNCYWDQTSAAMAGEEEMLIHFDYQIIFSAVHHYVMPPISFQLCFETMVVRPGMFICVAGLLLERVTFYRRYLTEYQDVRFTPLRPFNI